MMFIKTTQLIKVTALPVYLENQSHPLQNHYEWAYTIQIENNGDRNIKLLNRHWHITDALGRVQEVRGPGVIGLQPHLKPGELFKYTSGTALATPSGIMSGSYEMTYDDGERFEVKIPAFSLDSDYQIARPN